MTAIVLPEVIDAGAQCSQVSPRIIIDQWLGHGGELDAPDWSQWQTGTTRELWCEHGYITNKFMRLAIDRVHLSTVSSIYSCFTVFLVFLQPFLSVDMTTWAIEAARGSKRERVVRGVVERRGFSV